MDKKLQDITPEDFSQTGLDTSAYTDKTGEALLSDLLFEKNLNPETLGKHALAILEVMTINSLSFMDYLKEDTHGPLQVAKILTLTAIGSDIFWKQYQTEIIDRYMDTIQLYLDGGEESVSSLIQAYQQLGHLLEKRNDRLCEVEGPFESLHIYGMEIRYMEAQEGNPYTPLAMYHDAYRFYGKSLDLVSKIDGTFSGQYELHMILGRLADKKVDSPDSIRHYQQALYIAKHFLQDQGLVDRADGEYMKLKSKLDT